MLLSFWPHKLSYEKCFHAAANIILEARRESIQETGGYTPISSWLYSFAFGEVFASGCAYFNFSGHRGFTSGAQKTGMEKLAQEA